jgi:ribosome-interacting GTPase 1
MPANLTPAYRQAEATYKAAVTREEKLIALEEMLRVIPKHKGTEKLQADLRSRISKLKKEPGKKAHARGVSHRIPREGAGQVALVGPPNTGKSSLVARLTKASPAVAEYPLTTREATPGMMTFGDVAFQLVDLPPLCDEHVESWVWDLMRAADLAWVVLSAEDPLGGQELVERLAVAKAMRFVPGARRGKEEEPGGDETGRRSDPPRPGWTHLPALLVLTGVDQPGAAADARAFAELIDAAWPWVAVSSATGEGLHELGGRTFDALEIMRVYTKEPGHDADLERPFTLPVGSTVTALARAIHGDLAEGLKYARVWGQGVFGGQRVRGDHVLSDRDVVELRS